MPSADEAEIQELLGELTDAWNGGDADAFGARYRSDAAFTNVNGGFYVGRDEFNLRHEEVFQGVFNGTTLALTIRKLRFLRPDVAIVDVNVSVFGCHARPPGVQVGSDGTLRTCLLMVLTKDAGKWWVARTTMSGGRQAIIAKQHDLPIREQRMSAYVLSVFKPRCPHLMILLS